MSRRKRVRQKSQKSPHSSSPLCAFRRHNQHTQCSPHTQHRRHSPQCSPHTQYSPHTQCSPRRGHTPRRHTQPSHTQRTTPSASLRRLTLGKPLSPQRMLLESQR
eukprot:Gregarina_sp_Pseudo_9__1821@NODE_223_length_3533_cov_22_527476_g207_i0_p5_GENE_NODE_223_length_3533_cov_22_527476_g207_i0NODE_223_length_3533_cov_22_527476_g207_i0_p5_ORF_typecomplete_len105_score5_62Thyroglobulin_1/PF00086_18/11_NODE_223_length_3533_cov_22_527476_g207_i025992913